MGSCCRIIASALSSGWLPLRTGTCPQVLCKNKHQNSHNAPKMDLGSSIGERCRVMVVTRAKGRLHTSRNPKSQKSELATETILLEATIIAWVETTSSSCSVALVFRAQSSTGSMLQQASFLLSSQCESKSLPGPIWSTLSIGHASLQKDRLVFAPPATEIGAL
eukprot:2709357-Amphidinium_carterae.1